jgi:hypothetical protein
MILGIAGAEVGAVAGGLLLGPREAMKLTGGVPSGVVVSIAKKTTGQK